MEIGLAPTAACPDDQRVLDGPQMNLYRHGECKFPQAAVLASSAGRRWTDVAAELRFHPPCRLPAMMPEQLEITLAVRGSATGVVARQGAGIRQETRAVAGTLWLCPAGVGEDDTSISGAHPEVLHLYIPSARFEWLAEHYGQKGIRADNVRYAADIDDLAVRQLGQLILAELVQESAAGRMIAETAAMSLTARIAQRHCQDTPEISDLRRTPKLSAAKLRRVLDFVETHIGEDLTLADLASVACLSPFHFARSFKAATGESPARYLGGRRLAHAKMLLAKGISSFLDIALTFGFSTQASFNRAFRRATGVTPGEYRRMLD